MCGSMVRCGTCNNNCCSGGSGEVNGEPCPDCDDAYNIQHMYHEDPTSVVFEPIQVFKLGCWIYLNRDYLKGARSLYNEEEP